MPDDAKDVLHRYLRAGGDALLWKLDGLDEYDVRRPLTPTGTNLLGLVKHVAAVTAAYLGDTFGRPFPEPSLAYDHDADPNADMWALPEESREHLVGLYRRVWAHADETVAALPLDAVGRVPHWPAERSEVTLHQVLVHLATEVHRHAGHADVVRELVDGAVGLREGNENTPPGDRAWWEQHHARVQQAAEQAAGQAAGDRRQETRA